MLHDVPSNHKIETVTMANLEELRSKVETLAEKITSLKKETPVNKDAIGAAVKELLDAKRTFAENNGGIGVDGKPFEEPLSKAEKKKRAKAEKSVAVKVDASGKQVCFICVKSSS